MDTNQASRSQLERLRDVLPTIAQRATALDSKPGLPAKDIEDLAAAGLLVAPFPPSLGGSGWSGAAGFDALRLLGRTNLSLGRLYEGHVNAIRLILRHGTSDQQEGASVAALDGRLFGVWNTESPSLSLRLRDRILRGGKVLCSGAGLVERALVTARWSEADGEGQQMVLVPLPLSTPRADLSAWTPTGMRASATGSVDLEGVAVTPDMMIGARDAYQTQPDFSTGAWRFLAVHLGALEEVAELLRSHLTRTQRGGDPHQAARLGNAIAAAETARLWVQSAAALTEQDGADPDHVIAYVDLARGVVERAALDVMELANRSVGLQAFMQPNPLERLVRDLSTYLRQPGPDHALVRGAAAALRSRNRVGEMWQ
ncbi:acyl-CoA dehydrogenase family protein [Plastoroseomonas arctica]|uniref:Acyl-CoA dehydrogenase n=1 Tax=Plastoroseomonas arctica TaxID=1509237 RepID=A0AAF1JZZ3_9PROT|nr:acyl-CoA dehydrogenase family protein [Plastoroseomonas arctica]MBR0656243.1 acyl-CoA dehydrogenase [Plastoroseomonas arctica]